MLQWHSGISLTRAELDAASAKIRRTTPEKAAKALKRSRKVHEQTLTQDIGYVARFVQEQLRRARKPRVVYHYTSANGLLGLLKSEKMWATDIRYLNDSQEFDFGSNLISSRLKARYKSTASKLRRRLFAAFVDSLSMVSNLPICIASFSAVGDLLSQWRAYCPLSGGFSVGFDAFAMSRLENCESSLPHVRALMTIASSFVVLAAVSVLAGLTPRRGYAQDPRTLFQAERAAVGGEAWTRIAAIRLSGQIVAGDAPGTFTELIDHRSGHSLLVVQTGSLHDESGFDGAIWNKQNGMVTRVDLPSLLADAETRAFLKRDGWWSSEVCGMKLLPSPTDAESPIDRIQVTPAGGTPIDVWLDVKTHLIVQTVAHANAGDQITVYSDWRQVGSVRLPFRQVQTDERGATTTFSVSSASVEEGLAPRCAGPSGVSAPRVDAGGHVLVSPVPAD